MPLDLLQLNEFNRIDLVFDGDSLYSYLHGDFIQAIDIPDFEFVTHENNPISIAKSLASGHSESRDFLGELDNFSIWEIPLTQEEVELFSNCPITGQEDGLVAYWDFNEGSGDTVYDLSGNNNHGLINGAEFSEDVPEQNCDLNTDIETVEEDQQNYSLSFDGLDDFIDIGVPIGFEPSGSHTFMFYEKHSSIDGCNNSLGTIIGEYGYAQTSQGIHHGYRGCEANCPYGNCFGVDFYNNNIFTESINDLTWKHWAISYNHLTYERSIYLNGDLVANDFSNNTAYAGPFDLIFGATQFLDSNPSIMGTTLAVN